jgi:nicotinamidase-related amidase
MSRYTDPDFASSALITIDTQIDTLDGQPLEIPGTSEILPNMKLLLELYRKKHKPIIHMVRIYKADGSNVDLCRKEAVEEGTKILIEDNEGTQLAEVLFPNKAVKLDNNALLTGYIQNVSPNEVIIYKPRWGAFYKTPLEGHLKQCGVNTIIFTGCNYPNCPRTSIYEASERDFRIVLVENAVSGLYKKAIEEMKNIGVSVLTVSKILQEINAVRVPS